TLAGRRLESVERRGKYLLFRFDAERVMISHLGMSGRWLLFERPPGERTPHVHARFRFRDGAVLWFQDPRRFGQLRVVAAGAPAGDASWFRFRDGAVLWFQDPRRFGQLRVVAAGSIAVGALLERHGR